jgi:hypothetical protein
MDASFSDQSQAGRNALVPMVIIIGIGSILFSFAVSNYVGMALAITALLVTQFALKGVSRSVWSWCVGLATTGFAMGFAALLMRIVVDMVRR